MTKFLKSSGLTEDRIAITSASLRKIGEIRLHFDKDVHEAEEITAKELEDQRVFI